MRPADQAVWPLYRSEHSGYRRWRKAVRFDDRILVTVWPEPVRMGGGRLAVRHRGLVALEEDHLSERPFVWAGLWTGIYPVALDAGGVSMDGHQAAAEVCLAVSLDPDGIHRLYELTREPGPDLMPEPRRVPMWVIPRWSDWKAAFLGKRLTSAALQLDALRGRVTVRGWWQAAGGQPRDWFTHQHAAAECLIFHDCLISEPASGGQPRLNAPAPPDRAEFFRARPWLRIEGQATLEEGAFEASLSVPSPGSTVSCVVPAEAVARPRSCAPNFWEPHSALLPVSPPVPARICDSPAPAACP